MTDHLDRLETHLHMGGLPSNMTTSDTPASAAKGEFDGLEEEPTEARGAKTEGIIRRDGYHIDLTWIRHGMERRRRLYDPLLTPLYPALADLLVYALEDAQPQPSQQAGTEVTVAKLYEALLLVRVVLEQSDLERVLAALTSEAKG